MNQKLIKEKVIIALGKYKPTKKEECICKLLNLKTRYFYNLDFFIEMIDRSYGVNLDLDNLDEVFARFFKTHEHLVLRDFINNKNIRIIIIEDTLFTITLP